MTWTPKKGEYVRVGPVSIPAHEWVGEFLAYTFNPAFCMIRHPIDGPVDVRVECIRGPADA